jgi:hypothetical protein
MSSDNAETLERWLRPLPFGVFLLLALAACYPQVLFGWESFYARDYGVLAYPNVSFHRESFWRGEMPMWNPYSNCGQPFLAQWGTMTLYPFSLIYLLLPLPWSLGIFCIAHVWLGGLGMYLLARRWTESNFAGALAGTLYVFNGIMLASFAWPNYLVTLGWMPFVVLLAERAWREGGRWLVGASLVGALQMLSGAPEVIVFTWLIIGVLCFCDAARAPGSIFPFVRRILAMVLLIAGLSAAQLIPFFELLQESHRDTTFATTKWQLPLWGWANFLVPLYNAFETPGGQYFQYDQGFLTSVYLGGVAIVFALLAVFRWPDVRVWALFLLALVSVLLAFGDHTPIYNFIRKTIPLVGIARYPVKFLFVLAFIVPLLAGCGMAALLKSRLRHGVVTLSLLMLAAIVLIAWAAHGQRFVDYGSWPDNFRLNAKYSWAKAAAGSFLPDGIMNTLLRVGLFLVSISLLAVVVRARSPVALAFAGLALIAVDARLHTPRQNPTLPSAFFKQHYWPAELPVPGPGHARAFITPQAEGVLTYLSSTNAQRLWEFKRRAQWSSLNLLDRVPKVNGSSTLQTREQRLVEQTLYSMTNQLPAALLDFLGAAWITSSNSAAEWSPRPSALPFVTAGQQPIFAEEVPALAQMTRGAFDFQQSVILSPTLRAAISHSNAAPAIVTNLHITHHSLAADIDTPAATLAVIAQSHYPAWRATVDGAPVPLLAANLAFQAVAIPPGRHRLQLTYSDYNFRAGVGITAASLLACLVFWLRVGRLGKGREA